MMTFWNDLTSVFFAVMVALSGVGLLVGGVGVIGIMMISVTERTREIGLRKAMGARRRDLLWQFLVEAATLTLLGGAIGMSLGGAIVWLVASLTPVPAVVPTWSIFVALLASIFTGVGFGLYPAARGAGLDPVPGAGPPAGGRGHDSEPRSIASMADSPLDVLAVGPHPDDVELLCGGTLARCADQGYRTGILDLTRGEMGSRGSAEIRAAEGEKAAGILGVTVRLNAGLPDAGVFNTTENREALVKILRTWRPRVVILPFYRGRHPDHRLAAELARDACFLSGLARYGDDQQPHRPDKVIFSISFREDPVKPTFVVDIEQQFDRKMDAIRCYSSQFKGVVQAGEAFPTGQPFYDLVEVQNRHYGSLIRRGYGEPFLTDETVVVEDITRMSVPSV
jgi:bacillithiol biosynthesis deacetylase BshB1